MKRKQIENLVKLFNFKKIDEDNYVLKLPTHGIFLYYFKDKPKGWEINIVLRGGSQEWIKRIDKPIDLLMHISEFVKEKTTQSNKKEFSESLLTMYRKFQY